MKELLKNKKIIIGVVVVLVLILSLGLILFLNSNKKNEKSNTKKEEIQETQEEQETYTMYVKINPLVKLTIGFRHNEVLDYELINDDAKEIYKDINLKGENVYNVVGVLCKVARDNGIAFESINVTTDFDFNYEEFKKEMANISNSDFTFEIELDIKERLDEEEIIENYEKNEKDKVKSYNVIFNSNGGSKVAKQVVKENEKAIKPADPTRKDYKFVEWQLNGKKYDFDSTVTSNINLKAKWEKESTNTQKPNTEETKPSESTKPDESTKPSEETKPETEEKKPTEEVKPSETEKPSEETKPSESTKPSEDNKPTESTKPSGKSTPDYINLNDNILVDYYTYWGSDDIYVFSDNVRSVLKDSCDAIDDKMCTAPGSLYDCHFDTGENCDDRAYNFQNKLKEISNYNYAQATKAKKEMENYLEGQKGIINIQIEDNPADFKYHFESLQISNRNVGLDEFKEAFNNKYVQMKKELDNIFYKNGGFYIWIGSGGVGDTVLLDEALCEKYNLTCDRW